MTNIQDVAYNAINQLGGDVICVIVRVGSPELGCGARVEHHRPADVMAACAIALASVEKMFLSYCHQMQCMDTDAAIRELRLIAAGAATRSYMQSVKAEDGRKAGKI